MPNPSSSHVHASVAQAHSLISSQVVRTPVLTSTALSDLASKPEKLNPTREASLRIKLFFRCENLQKAGSFKIRGATHVLAKLDDACLKKGLVSHSTGKSSRLIVDMSCTYAIIACDA